MCLIRARHKQTVNPTKKLNKKPAIATISKKMTLLTEIREYFFLRELGNNQIKELPTGVFNNNTELIKLCVIDFTWLLWW